MVMSYPKNSFIGLLPLWFPCGFPASFYYDLIRCRIFFFNLQRQALKSVDLSVLNKVPADKEKNAFSAAVGWDIL